jgi:hypothetical protein
MTLDVEQKLAVFSQTCDEYDRNPVSLLDDILLYTGSHDHQDEDDSTIIDCYLEQINYIFFDRSSYPEERFRSH